VSYHNFVFLRTTEVNCGTLGNVVLVP